jgi:hypothetical protein
MIPTTHSGPLDRRETTIVRVEESEQSADKFGRLDRLVQSLCVHQWPFKQLHHEIVVPLCMVTVQDDPGVVNHLNELSIIKIQTRPKLGLLDLFLPAQE